MKKSNLLKSLKHQLIVSCYAKPEEALYCEDGHLMKYMAQAAAKGGAMGILAEGESDIKAIKEAVELPIIGFIKKEYPDSEIKITPTMAEIDQLMDLGVDIIALDATNHTRAEGKSTKDFVTEIREKYDDIVLLAGISSLKEAEEAEKIGFDAVALTEGKVADFEKTIEPNYNQIKKIRKNIKLPVFVLGNVDTPKHAKKALEYGGYAVVVGSAITSPETITKQFMKKIGEL